MTTASFGVLFLYRRVRIEHIVVLCCCRYCECGGVRNRNRALAYQLYVLLWTSLTWLEHKRSFFLVLRTILAGCFVFAG